MDVSDSVKWTDSIEISWQIIGTIRSQAWAVAKATVSDLWSVINEGLAKVVRLQNVRYFCGGEPGSRQDFAVDTTDTLSRLTPVSITRNNRGIIANTKRPNRLIIQL